MTKHLTVSYTTEGLEKAAAWLDEYKKDLKQKVEHLISRMVGEGKAFAISNVNHIDTGLTISSVVGIRNGNKGIILAGGNAIWIEFGTGVVLNGADDVHDRASLGMSEWGTFAQDGSGVSQGANANGWYYHDETGTLRHTLGMPMNPFFYNTAKMLRDKYGDYAKEIFK